MFVSITVPASTIKRMEINHNNNWGCSYTSIFCERMWHLQYVREHVCEALTRKDVSTSVGLLSMHLREEPCVVPFLDNHKCHFGKIILLQRLTSLWAEKGTLWIRWRRGGWKQNWTGKDHDELRASPSWWHPFHASKLRRTALHSHHPYAEKQYQFKKASLTSHSIIFWSTDL